MLPVLTTREQTTAKSFITLARQKYAQLRTALLTSYGHVCFYCNEPLGEYWHIEQPIPCGWSHSTQHIATRKQFLKLAMDSGTVVCACSRCNMAKGIAEYDGGYFLRRVFAGIIHLQKPPQEPVEGSLFPHGTQGSPWVGSRRPDAVDTCLAWRPGNSERCRLGPRTAIAQTAFHSGALRVAKLCQCNSSTFVLRYAPLTRTLYIQCADCDGRRPGPHLLAWHCGRVRECKTLTATYYTRIRGDRERRRNLSDAVWAATQGQLIDETPVKTLDSGNALAPNSAEGPANVPPAPRSPSNGITQTST